MNFARLSLAFAWAVLGLTPAVAGTNPFLGEIMLTGAGFCPHDWAEAAGQSLPISSNGALFALYGTTYGGNGTTTFNLPDLRGRIAMGEGSGPGLANRPQGQMSGQENTTLTLLQMPAHSHQLIASLEQPNAVNPAGNYLPRYKSTKTYATSAPTHSALAAASIGYAGGNQPFSNLQPSLTLRYCIATAGVFPQY